MTFHRWHRSWGRLLTAALPLFAAAACDARTERSGDAELVAEMLVSPTPASTTDTRVVVMVTSAGVPVADASVSLGAEGPGDPVDVDTLAHRDGGRYASGPLTFSEAGRWTLVVRVRTSDGLEAVFRRPVTVSGPPGSP